MKKKSIAIIFFLNSLLGFAQVDFNRDFVVLYPDSAIIAKRVELKTLTLGNAYFSIDSVNLPMQIVKFYKNEHGFYANLMKLKNVKRPYFVPNVHQGKINLFEKNSEWISGRMYNGAYGGNYVVTKGTKSFYSIDLGDLKVATYRNLKKDLASNAESLKHLEKFKVAKNLQTAFNIIGGGCLLYSLASFVGEASTAEKGESIKITDSAVTFFIGFTFRWAGYGVGRTKYKHIRSAVEQFNNVHSDTK